MLIVLMILTYAFLIWRHGKLPASTEQEQRIRKAREVEAERLRELVFSTAKWVGFFAFFLALRWALVFGEGGDTSVIEHLLVFLGVL